MLGPKSAHADQDAEAIERSQPVSEKAFETIRMTHDFREAILGYQLRLHYQPIINIVTGKVAGFEALMRWSHPAKGMISDLHGTSAYRANLVKVLTGRAVSAA